MNNNKVALVTGASQGIGKAVSIALAEDGYHVILLSRNIDALAEVEEIIKKNGGSAFAKALDVSESNKVKETIDEIIKQFGRIDVLFNNAGILHFGSIDLPDEDMKRIVYVNLLGSMYMAKYVGLQMKEQKFGYIMNLSSMSGQRGLAGMGCYAATKFGLVGFNQSLFRELIRVGVKVTSICPSFVATQMTTVFDFPQEKMIKTEDIVKTVRFLLDVSENAVINNINVDCAGAVGERNH